jgi:cytochrome c oxidase accessory protein FixG
MATQDTEKLLQETLAKDESFRDSIGTIDEKGGRKWLFPKKPAGRLTNYRRYVSYVLLAIFFSFPFLRIDGQPMLMLNVLERKFVIFGQIFWPADFFLFVLAAISGILFIAVFTVAFGRLFCGWICPQTIFMEHVFRRIEYWIEGDRNKQLKLSRMSWKNPEKIRKRVSKNVIFYGIAFLISNFFLMYIIGNEAWWGIVSDPPSQHLAGLSAMIGFSGVFYFVFAWFREQVCIMVCPYGRLQGALLDRNSIVIAYDYLRGEKRGKYRKKEDREALGKGDCIDCHQCVDVCPTGIDIRDGTQLECINCTACIDACDSIMDKVGKPRGLIRYDSENNIAEGKKKIWTARVKAYSAVLVILLGIFGFLVASRSPVQAIFLRVPGQRFQTVGENHFSNAYNFKLMNKTPEKRAYHFQLLAPAGGSLRTAGDSLIQVAPSKMAEGAVIITLPQDALEGTSTDVEVGVYHQEERIETIKTGFTGPLVSPTFQE